jgi:hypothetical protein
MIRAKIGIQIRSGDRISRAKSRDRLKKGDFIRLYIHPEHSSFVYIIHSDNKEATLLNSLKQTMQSSTLVMPSLQQYYQVDGKSKTESFTIICSPNELKELSERFKDGGIPCQDWDQLKNEYLSKNVIELPQDDKKPFAIAGNVRGAANDAQGDPFSDKLQVFSGKSMVVKHYEFRVIK